MQTKGFRILHENYVTPLGEIDLIAQEKDVLVFVEVKTRTSNEFGPPQASVTPRKQHQIVKVAELFLQRHRSSGSACRFDVVAVTFPGGQAGAPEILLIRDAFSSEGTTIF
ncbi:MAG: YraN family protein [Candidatus Methylomirabilis sp.]|nr:YraN family protein [Candidatus Methylomirabilis sp.]